MSISRVQSQVNHVTTSTSNSVTMSAGVTQGNLLIAGIATAAVGQTWTPPSGWTSVGNVSQGTAIETAMYYIVVTAGLAGTTSFSFSYTVSSNSSLFVAEWSSTSGWQASPLDQSTTASSAATTTISSGTTPTTTQASELWTASMGYVNSPQTESGLTSGWSDGQENASGGPALREVYQIASSTGAASASFTIGTAQRYASVVATFKPSSASRLRIMDGYGGVFT